MTSAFGGALDMMPNTHTKDYNVRPCSAISMESIADQGVVSSISVWPHTFMEMIDHKILSMVILLLSLVVSYKCKYVP